MTRLVPDMGVMSGEKPWPEEWKDVPPWARFKCIKCGVPLRALEGCSKCYPQLPAEPVKGAP